MLSERPVLDTRGMVACAHYLATQAGVQILTQGGEDLSEHTSNWVEPISTNYLGYDVNKFPPNTHGIAALEMLNILEGAADPRCDGLAPGW